MSSIFEFFKSKLGYVAVSMKISGKKFWFIFKTFLTNRGENGDENEKLWETDFNFSIFYIKIRLSDSFHENLRRGKNESEDKKNWKNEFDFWIVHIKIRLLE